MDYTVENLNGLLFRSKLMPAEQVRATFERWQKEGKDKVASSPHFIRWLVTEKILTEYQAALLSRGQVDDFVLGKYKILDRLGKGRMAGVYKAMHESGQIVAIKVLPPSRAKDTALLNRFHREAKFALKLRHPNVVRAFEVDQIKSLHFLVMEYLEGETLEEVLKRRKKLPPTEAVRIVYQALQGLHHIYEQGLIHRDMKPSNLMLVPVRPGDNVNSTMHCQVKILDIGLGREFYDENARPAREVELTGEGVILGTPDYLAPEQARDPRSIDIRADIYSIGCLLYHCLAGRPPFPDTNILAQMLRHATEEPKPIKEFTPEVPDGLQQIINWMLAKDPNKRYPTPTRAAQAMQMFLVAGAESKPIEESSPQMKKYLTALKIDGTGTANREPSKDNEKAVEALPVASRKTDDQIPVANIVRKPMETPLPAASPSPSNSEPKSESGSNQKKKSKADKTRKKDKEKAKEVPTASPLPVDNNDIDVELVTLPLNALSGQRPIPVTLRDWLLVSLGGIGVTIAILLGYVISVLV